MHGTAYVALGSNLPFPGSDSPKVLTHAVCALQAGGLKLLACSGIWRTAAWPPSDQPDYYNAVVAVDAGGWSPQELYEVLRATETLYGRERRAKWAARTLDLDIVAMAGFEGTFGDVTLPHPHMHERAFVLAPLAEIAPEWRHPELGRTVAELLAGLAEAGAYRRVGNFPPEAFPEV